ncbi:MAG TPA: hypothetical protein VEI03_06845 [Stellaceae bacterium]|nr:hypothetical protein [Stellaceae bacterium]
MSALETLPQPSDAEIEELVAAEDKRHAMARLSALFAKRQDLRYLLACARLLGHFEPYLAYHHDALWRIVGCTAIGKEEGGTALRDKIVYEEAGPSYLRVINRLAANCRFPPRIPHGSPRKRVLFLSHALFGGRAAPDGYHSPTVVALEYAGGLARVCGMDALLLDVRSYPEAHDSDFVGAAWTHDQRAPGFAQRSYRDGAVPVYTAKTRGMSMEKIVECMQVALQFNPDWVIAHGHFHLVGDLLAAQFPTLCLEMSRSEPVSLAHSFILFEGMVRELRMPKTGPLPRAPKIFNLSSHVPLRQGRAAYERERFGIPPQAVVYVIVGYRLGREITDEFEAVMARILETVPDAMILTVGGLRKYRHPLLAAMPARLRHIEFEPELRSLFALCDCYLNPPREGGGTSALMALLERLPILTLPDCDVAGVIGNVNSLPDIDALAERAINLGLDARVRSEARKKARKIVEQAPDFDDTLRELGRILAETREDFDLRRIMGAA